MKFNMINKLITEHNLTNDEFKIILEKSQIMRYNACVILAEEYNFN